TVDSGQAFTMWATTINTWLCPSDPDTQGGRRPSQFADVNRGNYPINNPPIDPSTKTSAAFTPVANYAGSFGDNYCIGPLTATMNPWETRPGTIPPAGQPRIGWSRFWGTMYSDTLQTTGGVLRGIFDYRTGQLTKLADITDGTSNTVLAGEVLPAQTADSNLYMLNGGTAGMTVPLNLDTSGVPGVYPGCVAGAWGTNVWGCRFSYASKGFKSKHPGGANFLFCDGSVKFLKTTINRPVYAALGSKNGGEGVSADSY